MEHLKKLGKLNQKMNFIQEWKIKEVVKIMIDFIEEIQLLSIFFY